MRTSARGIAIAFAAGACLAPFGVQAFDSGSTGTDLAFNPTVNTVVDVPPGGIFNYTSVNIPAGVTVSYRRNTTNTPVVILASGNVTIAGIINVSGASAVSVGAAGDGATGDDGAPGVGGPGGFDGGRGGLGGASGLGLINKAGGGLGPGGGSGGPTFPNAVTCTGFYAITGGTGGGFFSGSGAGERTTFTCNGVTYTQIPGGAAYGAPQLLPLIGGSGGAGGSGGSSAPGAGGGGGGGAILIAASGTVNLVASSPAGAGIYANGGNGGFSNIGGNPPVWGATGGGGAGGAIRIIATTITGNGVLQAAGGARGDYVGTSNCCGYQATAGSTGRIRLEAENYTRNAVSNPTHTFASTPAPAFIAGTPTLRIARVAGVAAPASPTGNADITLPAATANPVLVEFETIGVPVGNTVSVTVTPAYGDKSSAVTPALSGSTALATASANVNLPVGPSVLSAQTTYTVVAALGDLLMNFAGNERVERVTLMATLGGPSKAKLTTVSGKEYEVPAEVLRIAALGG